MFADRWSPKIVGEVNDSHVKLAKGAGEFVWHRHEREDELFLVVKGNHDPIPRRGRPAGRKRVPDRSRGVEHMPVAEEEAWVLLFEPKTTLNTGDVENERTVANLERI